MCTFCFKASAQKLVCDRASGFSTHVGSCPPYLSQCLCPSSGCHLAERGRSFPDAHQHTSVSIRGRVSGPHSSRRFFAGCVTSCSAAGAMHTGLHSSLAASAYSSPRVWEGCHRVLVVISSQGDSGTSCNPPPFEGEGASSGVPHQLPSNLV